MSAPLVPLRQVRYNQEFRLPGRDPKDFYHLAQYRDARGRGEQREVLIRDRQGREEWLDWNTSTEPTTP